MRLRSSAGLAQESSPAPGLRTTKAGGVEGSPAAATQSPGEAKSGSMSGRKREDTAPAEYSALASIAALVAWSLASSVVIFANKHLMVNKQFPYPMLITAVGQLAAALGGAPHPPRVDPHPVAFRPRSAPLRCRCRVRRRSFLPLRAADLHVGFRARGLSVQGT